MATYTIQGPSGKTYTIEGPDGATPDQLGSHILSQSFDERVAVQQAKDRVTYSPTSDTSFGENLIGGIGRGMTSIGRAVGLGDVAGKFGLPATKEDAAQLDGPLMKTWGGKVGNVFGQAATVAPAAFAPGVNTLAGAALMGGALGATTTEGGAQDRIMGAANGALGGAFGQSAGAFIGAGFGVLSSKSATNAAALTAANAGKSAAVTTAQDTGYVLPPSDAAGGVMNSILQGVSGKIKTAQTASQRNQPVTNNLVKNDLGMAADQPITINALNGVRSRANAAYTPVSNSGTVVPGQKYTDALDAISAPYVKSAAGFPNSKPNPIISAVDELRSPQFDASSAVAKVQELRDKASTAYASGDKSAGSAYRSGADAIENALDEHLTASGAPRSVIQNFRDARQTIAKTWTAQAALNPITGDISAQSLARRVLAGKPLSGGMADAGQVAAAFPKAMQALKEVPNQVSPLDMAVATLGNGALLMARPAARSLILSKPYQRMMASPQTFNQSPMLGLLDNLSNNDPSRRALTLGTAGLLSSPTD